MVRYLEYIALFLAIAAILGACSNSLEPADPFEDLLSIQFESCDNTESGDIRYKAEKDEYSACIDEQWMHVDINAVLQDYSSDENDSATIADPLPCNDGDKKFKAKDSSYKQCSGGIWKRLNENWVIIPVSERFLQVEQGKFIPNANFNTPFALQPPQPLNGGIVRCTFDGSEPDSTTQEFIENRVIDSTTVVRCYEFVGNEIKQKQTETYFINESINMPVVSISVVPDFVTDYIDKPCNKPSFGEGIEYPTHVEFYESGSLSSSKDFEIEAGISLAGSWSKTLEKKSLAIKMRDKYQQGKLHYPLFETRPESNKFKAFILRNNGNRFVSDYIGDAVATSLLEGTNVDYQRSKQVVVFCNGLYRGIYDLREKLNEHFIETNYGIKSQNVDLVKHMDVKILEKNGSADSYLSMLQYIQSNDFEKNNAAYDSVKKMLDIVNYMEYMSAEIYFRNSDWPYNNIRAWRNGNNPWKLIAYDIDLGLDWKWGESSYGSVNMIEWIYSGGSSTNKCHESSDNKCFHNTLNSLIKNKAFKQAFVNRACYMYSTFINGEKMSSRIDEINQTIDKKQIQRDMSLYNRPKHTNTCGTGFDPTGNCLKEWSKKRDNAVREEFRDVYKLGRDVNISITIKGNGRLKLDNEYVIQQNNYQWTVFEKHPLQLTAECYAGSKFVSWENGVADNNRLIYPTDNTNYTAECR